MKNKKNAFCGIAAKGVFVLQLCAEGDEVISALGNAEVGISRTLELNGNEAVVARATQNGKALRHGDIALADGTALQAVAGAGLKAALEMLVKAVLDEILGVNVHGVGGKAGGGSHAILIGAGKIAYIKEDAVIIPGNGIEKSLYAVAVLGDVAVVFGAGADTQRGGVIGDAANVFSYGGQHQVKAATVALAGQLVADVVAQDRCA